MLRKTMTSLSVFGEHPDDDGRDPGIGLQAVQAHELLAFPGPSQ